MISIAIVDDDKNDAALLCSYIERYEKEHSCGLHLTVFTNAIDFLEHYKPVDVVFMDIQMPYVDGMRASQKLREIDEGVVLVFVTTMAKYAIRGYSVDALDFVIKPVDYRVVSMKMKRILRAVSRNAQDAIAFSFDNEIRRVPVSDVRYFESSGHTVRVYCKGMDSPLTVRQSLGSFEERLSPPPHLFIRCNHCFLVNPRYITRVEPGVLWMGDETLQISRSKQKPFMEKFSRFVGQG